MGFQDSALEKLSEENLVGDSSVIDVSSDAYQSSTTGSVSDSISEAQRCMSLYFALCTKVCICCLELPLYFDNYKAVCHLLLTIV